jgi:hypothetical protein
MEMLMALKDTINALKKHVQELHHDLEKATAGVKAAAQRVRIGTIRLSKIAKVYRKESIAAEKLSLKKKASASKAAKKAKSTDRAKRATAKLPSKKK